MKNIYHSVMFNLLSIGLLTIWQICAMENTVEQETKSAMKVASKAIATQEQAVGMLNELIAKNAAFSIQIAHPELAIKVRIWQKKGLLTLPEALSWETFKKEVHQFGVDLYALLEKDAKGAYYHIENLRKNNALYQMLEKLNQEMPYQDKEEKGEQISKLAKPSSHVLAHKINHYASVLYTQKLLELLKAFFKQFEERAKKLRAQEEQAQRVAQPSAPRGWFDELDIGYARPDLESTIGEYETMRPEFDEDTLERLPKDAGIDWGF